MTSAPTWKQQDWTTPPESDNQRDDLIRALESSLSRSAPRPSNSDNQLDDLARNLDSTLSRSEPRPSNQQERTTPPKSDNQRDDLDRELEYLSRGAPRPPNQRDWTTPPRAHNQNSGRPSIGRRVSRTFVRYFIVFLFGLGLTLAWRSHGDEAMEMVRTEVPSLAWLLPVSTAEPSPDSQASAAAPLTSDELVEQLKPVAFEIANVQRSLKELGVTVEQLGVKVTQMSQSIALQSVEQKLPPPPRSRTPAPKPPQ